MRQAISIPLILLVANILFADHAVIRYAPSTLPADRIIPADTLIQINHPIPTAKQPLPRRDDIIGERFEAGDTWFDFQTNGSIGKLIEVDPEGGVHVTWMGSDQNQTHQKYNYYIDEEWILGDGCQVDEGESSGYGCLCLTNEDELRGMVFTHCVGEPYGDEPVSVAFLDFMPGWGAFFGTIIPGFEDENTLWPQGVMSPEGIIHTVASTSETNLIGYAPGFVNNDEEIEFDVEEAIEVSETHIRAYRIARSPNSERAAIAWMNSRVGVPAPEHWEDFLAYQMNNDLLLAWTDNGEEWNFDDPLNITNCIEPDPERRGDDAYGDTYRPYCTIDLIFDADDNIHVAFDARGFWENPEGEGVPPVDRLTTDASYIFHWSEETERITPVADGWFSQDDEDDNPRPGPWKSNVCNPSLAYDENGDLYCVYEYYPHGFHENGYCYGDIMVTVSEDNGETWFHPTKVVETPGEEDDEALSEIYPTVAERVDDCLHIFYEEDQEPGSFVQDENLEPTLNPFFYHVVPIDEILRDRIWQGPHFHYNEGWEYVHVLTIDEFTFENESASEGWEIDVFTEDDRPAGNAVWREGGIRLFARGDDPGTEEVEGFCNGERMTFSIYNPDEEEEYPVDVEFTAGPHVWINGQESVIALNAYEIVEQTIVLEQGWNIISLNVVPVMGEQEDRFRFDIRDFVLEYFDQIDDEGNHRVLIVKNSAGDFCVPGYHYWGIIHWNSDEGYLFKVTEDFETNIFGRRIDPQTEIEVDAGWSMIAYLPDYELDASAHRGFYVIPEDVLEHLRIAKDGRGNFLSPQEFFSNMQPWRPGQGYFLYIDEDVTWVYPEEMEDNAFALLKDRSTDQPDMHWLAPCPTGENMSVLVTINGYGMPVNGQIAAFNPSGKIVGAGIVRDNICGLAVWGDDPHTEDVVEGLHCCETFELRLWNSDRDVELNLNVDNILSGSGLVYEIDGFTALEVSIDVPVPAAYYLGQAYPNPFNTTTRITFGLPEAVDVKISIFDLNGRLVKQLINRKMNAGNHTAVWEVGDAASGIYLLRMVTPTYKSAQKVILVR